MTRLQTLLDRTPAGGRCELEPILYEYGGNLLIRGGKKLVGTPGLTRLRRTDMTTRDAKAVRIQRDGGALIGITILGPIASGASFDPTVEGQHAIAVEGVQGALISNCNLVGFGGDGIYLGTDSGLPSGKWTTAARVIDVRVDDVRHAITANACDDTTITGLQVHHVQLSPVDVEPANNQVGCTRLRWLESDIYDRAGGFIFANKGEGSNVHDILLDDIRVHNRPFTVSINPMGARGRRHDFTIRKCSGAGIANVSPIVARHIDRLWVANIRQELGRGVQLVERHDCTDVWIDGIAA